MRSEFKNKVLTIYLEGSIDSNNSVLVEKEIFSLITDDVSSVILDATNLDYISSAGLRVVLKIKKFRNDTSLIEVNNDVYSIFDMTGFTELLEVRKKYRVLSVDGCEVIGEGANGIVYRINDDTIVKVYKNPDAIEEVKNEISLARKAFVLGVPTAIPYDIVKVGDLYGSVFELLSSKSFAELLIEDTNNLDNIVKESVDILKKLHKIEPKKDDFPSIKAEFLSRLRIGKAILDDETYNKLEKLLNDIPDSPTLVHGDYHLKNILKQIDNSLLIDMDTLSIGHPIFEFAQIYATYIGFSMIEHNSFQKFFKIDEHYKNDLFYNTLHYYFDDKDEAFINDIIDKARILSAIRFLKKATKPNDKFRDSTRKFCLDSFKEVLPRIDKLYY